MPAAIPIAIAVVAASSIYQGVEANQQKQHAIGAAQAQETAMNAQIADANKTTTDNTKKEADTAKAAQAQANSTQDINLARIRAMTAGSSNLQSSILTSPLGATAAPTATKTLLGA